MLSNNAQERAPRWPASDALFSVAKIEDALLSASAEVTRELQRRWPAGKAPVSYATRAAYRKLARQQRLLDGALAATDRLRKQGGTAPQDQAPQPPRTNGGGSHDADAAIAAAI